jgi:hypothetical protein
MMSRTEFGDLPYYTFRALPLCEQRDDVFGLDQSDVLLQASAQPCEMERRVSSLDWHLGDPDMISFDAHCERRRIIRPQVESAPAAQVESGVMPMAGK